MTDEKIDPKKLAKRLGGEHIPVTQLIKDRLQDRNTIARLTIENKTLTKKLVKQETYVDDVNEIYLETIDEIEGKFTGLQLQLKSWIGLANSILETHCKDDPNDKEVSIIQAILGLLKPKINDEIKGLPDQFEWETKDLEDRIKYLEVVLEAVEYAVNSNSSDEEKLKSINWTVGEALPDKTECPDCGQNPNSKENKSLTTNDINVCQGCGLIKQ